MKNLYKIFEKSVDKNKTKCYNKEVVTKGDIKQESTLKSKQYPLRNQEPKRFIRIKMK